MSTSARGFIQAHNALRHSMLGISHQPKCYGAAKNFMTNALKANPNTPLPAYPWIFAKPFSSVKPLGQDFLIPWHAEDNATVHEVELGVILNGVTREQAGHNWRERIGGYCLLLDMGDFDLIKKAIGSGTSWSTSKMQDNFLVLGDYLTPEQIKDPHNCDLQLKINGKVTQEDNTGNMLFKINDQLDFLELECGLTMGEGDLLMTGTPEGIAPVQHGDLMEATIHEGGQLISQITEKVIRENKPNKS